MVASTSDDRNDMDGFGPARFGGIWIKCMQQLDYEDGFQGGCRDLDIFDIICRLGLK